MVVWQTNVIARVPYAPNPSGYYYWQWVYFANSADWASLAAMRNRAVLVTQFELLDVCEVRRTIVTEPPGSGIVVSDIPWTFTFGTIASGGLPYTLINTGRLITSFADGRNSYRMWRPPALYSWFSGGHFDTTTTNRMGGFINAMRTVSGYPPFTNRYGAELIGGRVSSLVHGWQLRHGTKRRERVY